MSDQFPPTLSETESQKVKDEIEKWRWEITEEIGPFRTEVLQTGRILIQPDDLEVPHVAYMSDNSPDARLCLDDYVPEIGDFTLDPTRPSDDQ